MRSSRRIRPLVLATTLLVPLPATGQAPVPGEPRPCEGASLPASWGRLADALRAAASTQESGGFRYRAVVYERRLDPETLEVLEDASQPVLMDAATTLIVPDPDVVADEGFVRDSAGQLLFDAPLPRTLLSGPFLQTHCFRGLAFEPEPWQAVGGVAGTFEVGPDGEPAAIDYGYVGLPWGLPDHVLGGRIELTRLPSGERVITSSWLRTPIVELHRSNQPGADPEALLLGIRESGTVVVEVLDSTGVSTGFARPGAVAGVVHDSLAGGPLAGATVVLLGTDHRAVTGDDGTFTIPGVAPGAYLVTFEHPRRQALGFHPRPTAVRVPPGLVLPLELAIPTEIPPPWRGIGGLAGGLETRQGRDLPPGEGSWLTAQVLDAESAAPIEGMEVRMQGLSVITDSAGWFSLRQLRPGEHVIEFEHVGYGEGHARIEVPERRETIAQFRMPAQAVDLGELTVRQRSREEAARRMLPVGTQVLDVGDLEEAAARGARVGDALRDLSGLDIYYGAFYGPGHENRKADIVCIEGTRPFPTIGGGGPTPWCNMVEVYIDDMNIAVAGELLKIMPLSDFERIEYVPALGATRWGLRASETGVLLLYTRR